MFKGEKKVRENEYLGKKKKKKITAYPNPIVLLWEESLSPRPTQSATVPGGRGPSYTRESCQDAGSFF